MSTGPIRIVYSELLWGDSVGRQQGLSLKDHLSPEPQDHEEDIARYLESAPAYSGVGTIVGDVLNPNNRVVLFPGENTDGVYIWPAELAYYVRKYHLRLPNELVERMASLNWQPPIEQEIDWEGLYMADIRSARGD
jgi:hypothetical protein